MGQAEQATTGPGQLEQLLVLIVGLASIGLGLYGGLMLALAGPAYLPLGAAALLATATYLWRPDGSWDARVAWKAVWVCAALFALVGAVDVLLPDL
jgi:hypothetical protein